jgi:hypothetical protein
VIQVKRLLGTILVLLLWISTTDHSRLYSAPNPKPVPAVFLPGDVDVNGAVSTSDIIQVINHVFKSAPLPSPECVADVNADSVITLTDIIQLVNFVLRGGAAPQNGCTESHANYWPLALGNYWVYGCDSQHPFCSNGPIWRSDVTAQGADTALLVQTCVAFTCVDTFALRAQGAQVDWRVSTGEWGGYYNFTGGAFWLHRDPFECDDSILYRAILETEPVVTPAGTFTGCLRIEPLQKRCADAGMIREWWAPGVGMVRSEQDNIAGYVNYVLTEYKVE